LEGFQIKINQEKLLPTTRNILCILKEKKIVRLKKNTSRNTKYLDGVFEDFKKISEQNKEIKCFESSDPYQMIIMFDINYEISSFLI